MELKKVTYNKDEDEYSLLICLTERDLLDLWHIANCAPTDSIDRYSGRYNKHLLHSSNLIRTKNKLFRELSRIKPITYKGLLEVGHSKQETDFEIDNIYTNKIIMDIIEKWDENTKRKLILD